MFFFPLIWTEEISMWVGQWQKYWMDWQLACRNIYSTSHNVCCIDCRAKRTNAPAWCAAQQLIMTHAVRRVAECLPLCHSFMLFLKCIFVSSSSSFSASLLMWWFSYGFDSLCSFDAMHSPSWSIWESSLNVPHALQQNKKKKMVNENFVVSNLFG